MSRSRFAVLARSVCCATALLLAGGVRLAEACHTYEHGKYLEGIGLGMPPELMEVLHNIPIDFTTIETGPLGTTPCVDGMAGAFPCSNVDLLAFLALGSMGGGSGSSIWGWTDPVTGVEWALFGRSNGTAFVSLEDPANPVYVANLESQTGSSTWRELKAYQNHAFIVSDQNGAHGIQIFDLSRLRDVQPPFPKQFLSPNDLTALYGGVQNVHDITLNEETGFVYAVGSNECFGGLHIVNVQDPKNPFEAGCYSQDGYTHDVQCAVYHGPDVEHDGDEICFASNEDSVTIVDLADKANPLCLSRNEYAGSAYTHQGWLTADHRHFIVDDELDEAAFGHNRRSYVWDLVDLDDPDSCPPILEPDPNQGPLLLGHFEATGSRGAAIDHNQFIVGDFDFQANYTVGLSVLSIDDPATASLSEVGFFDTHPENNNVLFAGAWGNYPFFESGVVIVSDINRGLFVLDPRLPFEIFEDGFESGGTAAWDEIVP